MSELIDAVNDNDIDLVRELLDAGVDANIRDGNGWTALMEASSFEGNTEIVRLLLENGADPDIQSHNGWTVLRHAAQQGSMDIVRLLLDRGADPNLRGGDTAGDTALMWAAQHGSMDIVRLLLDRGVDPNLRDEDGDTALMWASLSGYSEIADLLRRHMRSTRIQSRFRGKQTRRKMRTQKAEQRLALSKLLGMIPDYDTARMVGDNIGREQYNPEVSRRMIEEEERVQEHLNWLQSFSQYDGGRRRRRNRTRKKDIKLFF